MPRLCQSDAASAVVGVLLLLLVSLVLWRTAPKLPQPQKQGRGGEPCGKDGHSHPAPRDGELVSRPFDKSVQAPGFRVQGLG